MRIFGMPLWPEKISDEQYVERTRKEVQTLRRWRYFFAVGYLGSIIGFIFLLFEGVHLLADMASVGPTTKQHALDSDQRMQ
ncbi:MAG: hypothetical protein ACREE6_13465, partial [Limisphaerales bacterium]